MASNPLLNSQGPCMSEYSVSESLEFIRSLSWSSELEVSGHTEESLLCSKSVVVVG